MNKTRINRKLSIGLFAVPIICLLLTVILVLTFFLINPITVGVPVDLHSEETSELSDSGPFDVITISENGRLFINDRELVQDKIPKEVLTELLNKKVYLRADKKVEYEKVMEIITQLKRENIRAYLVYQNK